MNMSQSGIRFEDVWKKFRRGERHDSLRDLIPAMLGKLAGHSMFQGAALERLKMCSDCRVIDIYSASEEVKITDL